MEVNKIYQGDTLAVLRTFPDECVDMCITSPPYYGLRNYGVEGQPYRWLTDWDKNNTDNQTFVIGNFVKMEDNEIRNRVFCWLKNCIGTLVFKGYLKVIPNFNFNTEECQKINYLKSDC